jgi:hypothetical protein
MNKDNPTLDERWAPYQKRFHSLPIFYFSSLEYPESLEEAKQILSRLEVEIGNIDAQFQQRKDRLLFDGQSEDETHNRDYLDWKIKAQKAQQMRHNQVAIIESWIYDQATSRAENKDRITILEKRVALLEDAIKRFAGSFYQPA